MEDTLFRKLVVSAEQMGEIARGERAPARETTIDAVQVKEIRKLTGLSQAKFAQLVDVKLGTLRNWEQGRREPTGPAQALMRVIRHDPQAVLKALNAG
ncbi:MAG TPA: transcriptional regulator [Halieaceae bacterium]|nr:transcriptional regulator [Halieaceae bacterium]